MSNPFVRNELAELSKKANMTGLTTGQMKVIGYLDLSGQVYKDVEVDVITFKTGATLTVAYNVEIYLATSEDAATPFSDNIDATSDADQVAKLDQCALAGIKKVGVAATTYYIDGFSVGQKLGRGSMPSHLVILMRNASPTASHDLDGVAGSFAAKARSVAFA